jgi:F0F1-type ATP synthase epsilon subunit
MDNHAPLLAVLPPGVIRYQISSGAEESIVCNGGTFELAENQAALLVEQPYRLDEIDTAAIRAQLATIQESGSDGTAPSGDRVYLELLLRTKESHG